MCVSKVGVEGKMRLVVVGKRVGGMEDVFEPELVSVEEEGELFVGE